MFTSGPEMAQGCTDVTRSHVGVGRDPVLMAKCRRLPLTQLVAQQLTEEVVIAEHRAGLVGSRQEQVEGLDLGQRRDVAAEIGTRTGRERLAQLLIELVDHAGVLEKAADARRLVSHDFLGEIGADRLAVAAQGANRCSRVAATDGRERGQLDPCGPAFGASVELFDVDQHRVESETRDQFARLLEVQSQIGFAQLAQVVVET